MRIMYHQSSLNLFDVALFRSNLILLRGRPLPTGTVPAANHDYTRTIALLLSNAHGKCQIQTRIN